MNTFEAMKHNIPEGATHYRDESDGFRFSWVMFGDGGALNVYTTALGWCRFNHSKFEDKVKPIPKIPTETKEDKEALDEKTYRYEKVEFEHAWEAVKEHEEKGGIFICSNDEVQNDNYPICGFDMAIIKGYLNDGSVYRRTEVTERELFIETYAWAVQDDISNIEDIAGMLFDSGKFKLVNGKG